MIRTFALRAAVFVVAALAGAAPSRAQTVEEFYRGKDVRLLIGADVGGTYGLYAQLARHLRKFIPGQPKVIMQAMPGAGGNVALNWSYAVAPKDGTLIHLVHAEVLFESLLTPGVKFSARDYQFIGRFADADAVNLVTRKSGVATLADARSREVTLGATGVNNIFALAPLLLNRLAGTKFRIIGGYKGTSDIYIAMERGEIDGAGVTYANVAALHADRLRDGDLAPVFAIAARRLADYPDAPAIVEFGTGAERTLMDIYASTAAIGRALAFPPGVPRDRVEALREAFQKTLDDPEFRDEARKAKAIIAPLPGPEVAAYIDGVMNTPRDQLDAARKLHEDLIATAR